MRRIASLVVAAALLFAAPAEARVELRWHGMEGCLDEAALARTVESTLDEPVFHGDGAPTATLEATFAFADGYRVHVVLRTASGEVAAEREIATKADCAELDESLAVVVAMMLDGVAESPTPTAHPVPPRVLHAPPEPRKRSHVVMGEVEAGVAGAIGLLPSATPGAFVRAGAGVDRFSVAVAGYGFAPADAVALGSGARISAWVGELSGCGALVSGARGALRVCVALGAGFTDATPIALSGASETRLPLVVDAIAIDGALRIGGPIWLTARAELWNPIVVPTYFFYAADGSRHDVGAPWIVDPIFSLGLSARFGS